MDAETWRPIPGFPGYDVSDLGRVRSYYKHAGRRWTLEEEPQRMLRPSTNPSGYLGVNLMQAGQQRYTHVAILVLLAFVGPCPEGMEVCHQNGNPRDNRLENLRYDTHLGNMRDRCFRNGQPPEVWTVEARALIEQGLPACEVAARFGYCRDGLRYHIGPFDQHVRNGTIFTDALRDEILALLPHRTMGSLSREYGIDRSTISLWASGKRRARPVPEGGT